MPIPYHDLPISVAGCVLKLIVYGCLRGGGTQLKISRNDNGRSKIFACIAGVHVTLPNFNRECGLTKL